MALELGCTVNQLKQALTERELTDWVRYIRLRPLPTRLIQHQLALLTLVLAKVNGNTSVTLDDFLIERSPEPPKVRGKRRAKSKGMTVTEGANILAAISGTAKAGVHVLGQGRKKGKVS